MPGGSSAYTLLGLTAVIGALAAAMTFAILRFAAAARDTRRHLRGGAETALLSAALEEAVTKLKAQERATAARADASERVSGEIIASLTAGLLVVGLDGEVRILNPAGRRMLHVPESAPEQSYKDYRRLLGHTPLSTVIDECLKTRIAVVRRPVQLPGPDGSTTHLGVTVSPLVDDRSGGLHGAICLFTDLTAIKELEEQLHLKESLATVGELTAGIAHEFRNGLATIHGYSKLIDLSMLPEPYRPYVEGIRSEAEALGQVVTNFLNFATPAKLTLSRIDLRAICERAAEEFRSEARALGGDVTVRGEFGALDGDEVLLRQAFSNLLRNAVEACAGASLAPVVVIRSESNRAQGMTQVVVEDAGPGIAPAERERIFRPFVTSKRNGTGLGLALVQKIIVFHNGRISAGDSPLGGASFHIVLPIAGRSLPAD
jgi:signal transduction histidine kinase